MKRYFFSGILLVAILLPAVSFADITTGPPSGSVTTGPPSATVTTGNPPPVYNVPSAGQSVTVKNPLGSNSFCGLVKNLLQAAIAIGIPVAVLFIVYAGFKFVLAQGNAEKLAEARKNFLWTIIGIAIFLGAWLLASVVANTVNALGGQQNIISCN